MPKAANAAAAAAAVALLLLTTAAAAQRVTFSQISSCSSNKSAAISSSSPSVTYRSIGGSSSQRTCAVECAASTNCAVFQFNTTESLCVLGSCWDLVELWLPSADCQSLVALDRLSCRENVTTTAALDTASTASSDTTSTVTPSTGTSAGVQLDDSNSTGLNGTVKNWPVPELHACYRIEAWGAAGGSNVKNSKPGGRAAHVIAYLTLAVPELRIVSGKPGSDEASANGKSGGGGGGGSFVYAENSTGAQLLVAAGGGGGASRNLAGSDAAQAMNMDISVGGDGYSAGSSCGGGGAGWKSSATGDAAAAAGRGRTAGWLGGVGDNMADGGFGGGGGGGSNGESNSQVCVGGGGGYSGGSSGFNLPGDGGSSFVTPSATSATVRVSHYYGGSVRIQRIGAANHSLCTSG